MEVGKGGLNGERNGWVVSGVVGRRGVSPGYNGMDDFI